MVRFAPFLEELSYLFNHSFIKVPSAVVIPKACDTGSGCSLFFFCPARLAKPSLLFSSNPFSRKAITPKTPRSCVRITNSPTMPAERAIIGLLPATEQRTRLSRISKKARVTFSKEVSEVKTLLLRAGFPASCVSTGTSVKVPYHFLMVPFPTATNPNKGDLCKS